MPLVNLKCIVLSTFTVLLFIILIFTDGSSKDSGINMSNRTVIRSNIAVLVMVNHTKDWETYEIAQGSLACYCKMFNYSLIQLGLDGLPEITKNCKQKDYFFRRHCVALHVYKQYPQIKWFMFLGADIGVINPHHFLEEYIDDSYDITFYERGFNYDIMADSYIAKNTRWMYEFMEHWIDYDWKSPGDWPGYDNGPIHQVFVDYFKPMSPRDAACYKLWKDSKDYWDEQKYVACARSIFNDTVNFDRARIITKTSRKSWARDGWLSQSLWSSKDFMFHGWKKHYFGYDGWYGGTPNPFIPGVAFPEKECRFSSQGFDLWNNYYNTSFMASNERVSAVLRPKHAESRKNYTEFINTIKAPID